MAFCLTLWATPCHSVAADDSPSFRAWGALVFASLEKEPTDPALRSYLPEFRKVFGYSRYTVLSSAWAPGPPQWPNWIIPGGSFYLKLVPANDQLDGRQFYLELYKDDQLILQSFADLPPYKPLFIRGPQAEMGQLIIVLEMRKYQEPDDSATKQNPPPPPAP